MPENFDDLPMAAERGQAPIDDPPTELNHRMAAAAPAQDSGTAVDAPSASPPAEHRPSRPNPPARVSAPADLRRSITTGLLIGVPIAACLVFGVWLLVKRRAPVVPVPAVVVAELPLPAPSPLPVVVPPTPAPPAPVPPPVPVVKAVPRLGGKPVVLEYTGQEEEARAVAGADPAAVARARGAFRKGNERLAAGDRKAAIVAYRASLKFYPGYVGAYRGLGRALAASGDKKQALRALKLYVKTVPEADDADAVEKVIDRLQKKRRR